MKRKDVYFILAVVIFFLPFILCEDVFKAYEGFNKEHGMIMSFIKFAILATMGETIGLRIRAGVYNQKGFGIIPRAIVWGFLGLTINLAFVIFSSGTLKFLDYMGMQNVKETFEGTLTLNKVLIAFCISTFMNTIYAPVMMTLHKITDTHIMNNGGTITGFLRPIQMGEMFKSINWDIQWNFVFKKTIPFFWIPAHTITFILPQDYRVLFAAVLGIALGVILSLAARKK